MFKILYKKIIATFMFALIIINCTTCYASNSATISNTEIRTVDSDAFVVSWIQLDNAQLTLANGQNIAHIQNDTTIKLPIPEKTPVTHTETVEETYTETLTESYEDFSNQIDICFVLDCSGSMSGDKLSILKESAIELIKSLSKQTNVSVSIIAYGGYAKKKLDFTSANDSMKQIEECIDSLKTMGLTATSSAINASEALWSNANRDENSSKFNILITDGFPTDGEPKLALKSFKSAHQSINFYTLIVGNENTRLGEKFELSDKVSYTSNNTLGTAIQIGIKNYVEQTSIIEKTREVTKEVTEYEQRGWDFDNYDFSAEDSVISKQGFSETDGHYVLIADEEIIYGSTLTLDYSIHVKSIEPLYSVKITDYVPYGMVPVSASIPTNTTYNSNNNTIVFDTVQPQDTEVIISLKINKLLASMEDVNELKNKADIEIVKKQGDMPIVLQKNDVDGLEVDNLSSSDLSIVPPFGKKDTILDIIILNNWPLTLGISFSILATVWFMWKKSKKSKKYK